MDFKPSLTIVALILMLLMTVYCDEEVVNIENLPKDAFILTKAELATEDAFMRKVSKELGKVSDEVRFFIEKILRVAKTLFKDWILKDDDGSDDTESSDQ